MDTGVCHARMFWWPHVYRCSNAVYRQADHDYLESYYIPEYVPMIAKRCIRVSEAFKNKNCTDVVRDEALKMLEGCSIAIDLVRSLVPESSQKIIEEGHQGKSEGATVQRNGRKTKMSTLPPWPVKWESVRIGMSKQEVSDLLDKPTWTLLREECPGSEEWGYGADMWALRITFAPGGKVQHLEWQFYL